MEDCDSSNEVDMKMVKAVLNTEIGHAMATHMASAADSLGCSFHEISESIVTRADGFLAVLAGIEDPKLVVTEVGAMVHAAVYFWAQTLQAGQKFAVDETTMVKPEKPVMC